MDIEFCVPEMPHNSLFQPIEEFPVAELYQQSVSLENTFTASTDQTNPSILLTLINDTLLLSNPTSSQVTPYAAINFNFDLKFEVIFQTQVTLPIFRTISFPLKSESNSSMISKKPLVSIHPTSM